MKLRAISGTLVDCLFLAFSVVCSMLLYVSRLGFYSDDWAFLSIFRFAPDQSLLGIIQAYSRPDLLMRPVQIVYYSILYWLFGLQSFGYHVVNACVITAVACLFYLVLRRLRLPRTVSLAVPLLYAVMPQYASTRFWFAAFQINLSVALYFLSLYAGLRALSSTAKKVWIWSTLSICSVLVSVLSYEVVLPLFFFNAFLYRKYSIGKKLSNRVLIAGTLTATIVVGIFKAVATTRLGHESFQSISGYAQYLAYLLSGALYTNFGPYVLFVPRTMWKILTQYPDANILLGGVLTAGCVMWYLSRVSDISSRHLPGRSFFYPLIVSGGVLFALGYAIFLVNDNIQFSATGIANRVAVAASVGLSLSIVSAIGWLTQKSRFLFSFLIATVWLAYFVIGNTLASFWVDSYTREKEVLTEIQEVMPQMVSWNTFILDGVCPYIGPAIVFESSWDLSGALQIVYGDETLRADVVKPSVQVGEDGVYTRIYNQQARYPYGRLLLYNAQSNEVYHLEDASSARDYFQPQETPWTGCPQSREGLGVPIF